MTNTLTLATVTTHGQSIPAPLTIVLVFAAVGYVLWSRMQGRPLKLRRLIVLPVILAILGITDLTGSSAPHLTPKDIAFLLISVAISALLGAARGATIQIYPNRGELWQRYRGNTVGLWIVLIAAKIVLLAIASPAGASAGGGTNTLLLSLGVSLLAEAAIVGPRAITTGRTFATGHKESNGHRSDSGRYQRGPIHSLLAETGTRPHTTSDGYRSDSYRSNRRHTRRGPIHRLLDAEADRQRPTGN
jgi:hypothetical protein